jgi:hypothetical protein
MKEKNVPFLILAIFILLCPECTFELHKLDINIPKAEKISTLSRVIPITFNLEVSDHNAGNSDFQTLILREKSSVPSKLLKCSKFINANLFYKNVQKQINAPVLHKLGLNYQFTVLFTDVLLI